MICCGVGVTRSAAEPADFFFSAGIAGRGAERRCPGKHSILTAKRVCYGAKPPMVDYTFRQLMMQAGMDSIASAGFHCNVCIIEDGSSLLIYVLYAG